VLAGVLDAKSGLDGQTLVPARVAAVSEANVSFWRRAVSIVDEAPSPWSLIQNSSDHVDRIRYGRQASHTLTTKVARSHISTLWNRYLVTCLTKTVGGSDLLLLRVRQPLHQAVLVDVFYAATALAWIEQRLVRCSVAATYPASVGVLRPGGLVAM
jgi:hypothetical protein